jgi:SAM-dependent methyltransferase
MPEPTGPHDVPPPRAESPGPREPRTARALRLLISARRYAVERRPLVGLHEAFARVDHRWRHPRFSVGGESYAYSFAVPPVPGATGPAWVLSGTGQTAAHSDLYSERTVEIPFAYAYYLAHRGARTLEIGNVLANRFAMPETYDVVDKYERGPRIRNEDVVGYSSDAPYDLIVSVSTLEHVGFDEPEKDPGKPLAALRNLERLLAPGGRMLVTVPVAYNPAIDRILTEESFRFTRRHFLRRDSGWDCWSETTLDDALRRPYGSRYACANAVAFLVLERGAPMAPSAAVAGAPASSRQRS